MEYPYYVSEYMEHTEKQIPFLQNVVPFPG